MQSLLKTVLLFVVFLTAFSQQGLAQIQSGGEVPWPLSNQNIVTVQNSQGLWNMRSQMSQKAFNVEMVENESGYNWIRISEFDSKTYSVTSWGSGYFKLCDKSLCQPSDSSFSNILLESLSIGHDGIGLFVKMYPNGNANRLPYVVRLVEVDTALGKVLGLSSVNYVERKVDHYLGTRTRVEPLTCSLSAKESGELTCFAL